jgi:hypothetical protein
MTTAGSDGQSQLPTPLCLVGSPGSIGWNRGPLIPTASAQRKAPAAFVRVVTETPRGDFAEKQGVIRLAEMRIRDSSTTDRVHLDRGHPHRNGGTPVRATPSSLVPPRGVTSAIRDSGPLGLGASAMGRCFHYVDLKGWIGAIHSRRRNRVRSLARFT